MTTARQTRGRFSVPCPHCGALDSLAVEIAGLTVFCFECSEKVTRRDVQNLAADAARLLRWLDAAAGA